MDFIKPLNATLEINYGQKIFQFDDITIRSDFDSGNCAHIERISFNHFMLWTAPDCAGSLCETVNRSWFYFCVEGIHNMSINFTLKNLNCHAKLFREGMRPVYKED